MLLSEPGAAPRAPSPTDKLAFLEGLLACDALSDACQLGADWLARSGRLSQIAIALVSADGRGQARLVGAASRGLDEGDVTALSVDLDDREHPLVVALGSPAPLELTAVDLGGTGLSFEGGRCTAFALPTSPARDPVALAMLAGDARDPEIRWTLEVLGRRLVALGDLRVLAATERRLARERALLQSILGAVTDPVLLTDPEGRLLLGNPQAELFFTSEVDESEGRRRAVALNNMMLSAALCPHDLEGPRHRELPLVDPGDGSDRLFELTSASIHTPEGRGVVSVLRNVTDLQIAAQQVDENFRKLRAAEASARAERDRLDLIIDSVADPIVVTDANGATTMMNAPAERLFTATPCAPVEEVLRVRANDAHFSSHVANLFFRGHGGRLCGELSLVDPKTAAPVLVEAISGKILSERGEVSAIVTILHDLTEQMEKDVLYEELKKASTLLEEKVRDATAELVRQNELLRRQALALEAASSAKSQFLANMSHEFRTPLNAILGYTSMMLQGVSGPLPPNFARPLRRIDSNGRQLLTIIDDILDIARIEAGRMPLDVTRFSPREVVKEVLSELQPLIERSGLEVRARFGKSVPTLRSDRAKVKQIIVNLVSNALKFTPRGAVTISVSFSQRRSETSVSVVDTGIGIAAPDQEAVFQAFRQVDSSPTRAYGGTGLGLAICRRLAHLLGGDIRLTSQVGKGSRFKLVLSSKTTPERVSEVKKKGRA